jgi:hypothetical protein
MKKFYIGIGITALMVLLLASAFAFSLTLQSLRVNALSFVEPVAASIIAAPMTSADEAEIASPESGGVRLEEFEARHAVCAKRQAQEEASGF